MFAALSAFAAAEEPIDSRFKPATSDPLIGDWEGSDGYVAQVSFDEHGDYQAHLFRAFDTPEAPVATLRGKQKPAPEVSLRGSGWSGKMENGHFLVTKGQEKLELQHVTRLISTLGAKSPAGAVVLFDGKNLDAWANKKGKEWLVADGSAPWKITADGILEVVPGTGGGIISHEQFGDCHMHVEFRTMGSPSNSGIFLQTRYEVNINETYGQLAGTPNGGLDNSSTVKPSVRATRAPLEWQTFDIDFRAPRFDSAGTKTENARASVWLNGVKLYENQELGPVKGAAGRLGEAAKGPMMLQEHGMPLQFRNIWVVQNSK